MNPRAPTNQSLQEIVILQSPVPVNCAQPYHKLIVQISTTFLPIGPTIKYARGLEIATLQLPGGTDKCVTELKAFKKKKKKKLSCHLLPCLVAALLNFCVQWNQWMRFLLSCRATAATLSQSLTVEFNELLNAYKLPILKPSEKQVRSPKNTLVCGGDSMQVTIVTCVYSDDGVLHNLITPSER